MPSNKVKRLASVTFVLSFKYPLRQRPRPRPGPFLRCSCLFLCSFCGRAVVFPVSAVWVGAFV